MSVACSIFASLSGLLFGIVVYVSGGGFWTSLLVWLAIGHGLLAIGLFLGARLSTDDEAFEADILGEIDLLTGAGSSATYTPRRLVTY